jgi:hypothetical protein
VALVELAEPLSFSPTIRPIRLAAKTVTEQLGRNAVAAGWGATNSSGYLPSKQLMAARLDVIFFRNIKTKIKQLSNLI